MANQNYGEVLCQAVDEIVRKRLEGVVYDSTILCTIVDNSRKDEGIYVVSNNGTTKFEAYSTDTSYRVNDNVYVQIPGGDWNQQKLILAKKKDKTEEPFIYESPFDSLVDITGNLINYDVKENGLLANGDTEQTKLWSWSADDLAEAPLTAYSRLGLSGSFQSWLNPFYDENGNIIEVAHGNYGYKLNITTENEKISTDTDDNNEYVLYLNCADMVGNPYNFQSYYHQEKVFDISQIGKIKKMTLYFYQQKNSFTNAAGTAISATDFLGNPIAPNLFTIKPYITLGYDIREFDEEMVTIYSLQPTTYSRTANETYNKKNVYLRWIHLNDDGKFQSINDESKLNYKIYWYRYELGHKSADQYSGVYWKHYARQRKDADWIYETWDEKNGVWNIDANTAFFKTTLNPDVTLQEEKIKAIILYNGKAYRSNILTLTNEDEVVSKPTVDAVQALSIVADDGTYGNYRIYGQNGSLLDMSERSIERTWVSYFKSSLDNQDAEPSILTEAESVEWIIPTERTMIQLEDSFYGDADEVTEEKDTKRIHIKRKCNSDGSIANVNTQKYKIKSYYSQSYSDNIIQCKVVKDKITYTATKELTFGTAGTTGTDYTFILDFDDGATALTINDTTAVTVTARLYDYENKEIEDFGEREITWSWKTNDGKMQFPDNKPETKRTQEIQLTDRATIGPSYNILQASMDWGDWKLIAYLPIPIRSSVNYLHISGTTQVIYNSAGEISACARNPYRLYYYDTTEDAIMPASVTWTCTNGYIAPEDIITEEDTIKNENAYSPTLKSFTDKDSGLTDYYLSPLSFYVAGACEQVCVTAQDGDKILWSQPILIMQNRYPSAMINEWDGALNVGATDPGTILAPRLVAGKKNGDNTFSGVVLGDWTPTNSDSSLTAGTGLFGYDKGEQSYGFRDDGTAFIGKSGSGRLDFNGSKSTITSNRYAQGLGGMQLDFDDGLITMIAPINDDDTTSSNYQGNLIILNAAADTTPLSIGTMKNFSVDWDGTLRAKNGIFQGTITGSTITGGTIAVPANTENPLFKVDYNGYLTATGANIQGTIKADKGNIGGWTIGDNHGGLTSNDSFSIRPDGTMVMGTENGKISVNSSGSIVIGKGSTATILDSAGLCVKKVSIYNIENGKKTGTIAGHLGYIEADFGSWENINSKQGIGLMSSVKMSDNRTPKNILKVTDVHIGATTGTTYWYIKDGEWSFATKDIVKDTTLITGITCKPGEIKIEAPNNISKKGSISLEGATVSLSGLGGSIGIANYALPNEPNGVVSISANTNGKLSLSADGASGQVNLSGGSVTIKSDNALNLTGTTISLQGSVLSVNNTQCTISNLTVTNLTVAENGKTTGVYATLK